MNPPRPVVTYFLELCRPEQFQPVPPPTPAAVVREARTPCPDLNRMFYETIGRPWRWSGRMVWTEAQWRAYVTQPELSTWFGYVADTPFGYFELETQPDGQIEIAIFGVLPSFVGQRLGGFLLSEAVRAAWSRGGRRVWLHTSSKDHPAALPNYQARGFTLYDQTTKPVPPPTPPLEGSA
jgi:GNAT superfamily N-acetyltransferase